MRAATLFLDIDQAFFKVHIVKIDVSDRRPAHAGFDQGVNDGPVAIRPVAFTPGPFFVPKTVTVFRASTDDRQGIGRI